ncbi:unnamed protein product [Didymodactylos carnosus]|uniref:G-protein coupled receptors family 1 profile domain-containing protein n=1 Tax=Didymodactylos carnosus TaxID=1234261 RepID=A0A814GX36_9BILA|nr:unnamed protein product [Didymodactylos carnosus]CAF1002471.1 unnamed protein product [Didymodactylos carnosus]CAF3708567.1 unnamed protein product [Didymodactylos carnosus]CAF3773887.1 unnamed protein product [Didymodactylos carnosus]
MIVFGLMTLANVRQQRRHVNTTTITVVNKRRQQKREKQMLRLVLFQALAFVILSLPSTICIAYSTFAEASEQLNFIVHISLFLLYLNFIQCFYINTMSAKTYRMEFYKILNQVEKRIFHTNYIDRQLLRQRGDTTRTVGAMTVMRSATVQHDQN